MKLWKGRFAKDTNQLVDHFNNSLHFDKKLLPHDIWGSIAHCKMLGKIGVLTEEETQTIIEGLKAVEKEVSGNLDDYNYQYEDVHMMVETLLVEKIGELGKKLHTGRSRNDQVALDIRLYMKDEMNNIGLLLDELLKTLLVLSENSVDMIMPGYTHLQRAQPIRVAFHLMAYFEMFKRDKSRLLDCVKRMDEIPLGSGALAGVSYETDRDFLAEELGFSGICGNAMDAVSDRDFAMEFLSLISILFVHISRFSEEIILWNSSEFKFVVIDDAFCTGSSIMPQKKNPDVAELARGKSGQVFANLIGLLTVMKGLPLAYNKDMQDDKLYIFSSVETTKETLEVFTAMLGATKFNSDKMKTAVKKGFLNATDMADYLVKKGVPFREAHEIVGSMVLYCEKNDKTLEELSLEDYTLFSDKFDESIYQTLDFENCIEAKKSLGSTSKASVEKMIKDGYSEINVK